MVRIPIAALIALTLLLAPLAVRPAMAEGFRQVRDKGDFVSLINGRALTRLGIRLAVSPGGAIKGRAFGSDVSGAWSWKGQYFCRSLYFGKKNLGDNCQEVKVSGATLRFTSDKGAGRFADLKLQ